MGLLHFLKPVLTLTAAQVKDFMHRNHPDSYHLVDVRQAVEYEIAHLPGAILIPLGEISNRIGELDPAKLIIAY